MEGFGDLFGSLGEMFGGLGEMFGERAGDAVAEAGIGAMLGGGGEGDAGATYDRTLTGGRRALNVNDL